MQHYIKIFLVFMPCYIPSCGWRPISCQSRFWPQVDTGQTQSLYQEKSPEEAVSLYTDHNKRAVCGVLYVFTQMATQGI